MPPFSLAASVLLVVNPLVEPPVEPESQSLAEQLKARQREFSASAPEAIQALYAEGIAEVAKSGILEGAVNVGDQAPEFALPDANGETVRLADLRERGPVVLLWYRGNWCPYCNLTLLEYRRKLDAFTKRGATVVAISPQTPDNSLDAKQKNELPFPVLSDVGNLVAKRYGIVFALPDEVAKVYRGKFDLAAYNGDGSYTLPLSATYLVDRDGTIRYAFLDADYRKRAEPAEVLRRLDDLKSQGR